MSESNSKEAYEGLAIWRQRLIESKAGDGDFGKPNPGKLDIMEQLLDESEYSKMTRISELDFGRYFVAMFAGEEDDKTSAKKISDWSSIAGGKTRYVFIVNNRNEAMFLVPPILDANVIHPGGHDPNASLTERINASKELMSISKSKADASVEHVLAHELTRIVRKPVDLDHFVLWNKIFRYYGKPLFEFPGIDMAQVERDYDLRLNGGNTSDEPVGNSPPAVESFDVNDDSDDVIHDDF